MEYNPSWVFIETSMVITATGVIPGGSPALSRSSSSQNKWHCEMVCCYIRGNEDFRGFCGFGGWHNRLGSEILDTTSTDVSLGFQSSSRRTGRKSESSHYNVMLKPEHSSAAIFEMSWVMHWWAGFRIIYRRSTHFNEHGCSSPLQKEFTR